MQDVIISESKLEDFIYNHLSGLRHVEHLNDFFESQNILFVERQFNLGFYSFEISIILIGSGVSHDDRFNFMPSAINDLEIYSYDICPYKGLIIKDENNWSFKDAIIPENIKNKGVCLSYSRHDFDCKFYHYQK